MTTTVGIVRSAMRALMATGHYSEDPNAFEWISAEAVDIAALPELSVPAVVALLDDTGLHDMTDPAEAACLHRDAEAIVTALTGRPS